MALLQIKVGDDFIEVPAIKGSDGKDFTIKGLYPTLLALQTAHPTGTVGDYWAVGDANYSYLYIWDSITNSWVDIGQVGINLNANFVFITDSGSHFTSNEVEGALQELATGKASSSHTHDGRYYTETELDNGQLDTRYYTEIEVNNLLKADERPIQLALSDETTTITTGTGKLTFRMPYACKFTKIPRINLNTVSSSGLVTVDIKKNGTTIFSTLLTIDANEKTSVTAATPCVLSSNPTTFADDDEISFDITVAGTGAKGLKATLYIEKV